MASYKNIKKEQVLDAIKGSYGIMLTIAKRLHCESRTAKRLINRWHETKEAYDDEDEVILDVSESKVYEAVITGDIATAKWVLSRKGKKRGWNEDNTLKLDNGEPLNISFDGMSKADMLSASNIELSDEAKAQENENDEGPAE